MIATVLDVLASNRTAWRRARNVRAGMPVRVRPAASVRAPAGAHLLGWIALAALLFWLGGAVVIVAHARALGAAAAAENAPNVLEPLRTAFAGQGATLRTGAQVRLFDRNGILLWEDGRPTAQASAAGLATLLGVRAGHANSIAGMLARLPAASGAHAARLTIDLRLQAPAQAALDCVGMWRGSWNGHACLGGTAPPPGRQAGLVLLDADTGEILAAAGSGMGAVTDANWAEVRDYDVANPAASALRVPAFQHDGGIERSPGSTFKIIGSLGLELAAQRDPRMNALMDGMSPAAIDALAQASGFAFRSAAAVYPADTRLAHVTNFHFETLDRRTQGGRAGLVQAMTYSVNTWFAWMSEMSDRTLLRAPNGGMPDLQALDLQELRAQRPIFDMAWRLGFGQTMRLDGGLLPSGYDWYRWDALLTTPSHIDPIHSRHELRQMAIGMRMQVTPLQMALAAGAVGQDRVLYPRLLAELDGAQAGTPAGAGLGVRLDRIRAGMKGVVERGTAASAFRSPQFDRVRPGLYGKTGTSPTGERDAAGRELATVWFAGWLEPGSLPGQSHRIAFAAFVTRSAGTGGEHVAPVMAALFRSLGQEQRGR